jgi:hypothetical protein
MGKAQGIHTIPGAQGRCRIRPYNNEGMRKEASEAAYSLCVFSGKLEKAGTGDQVIDETPEGLPC